MKTYEVLVKCFTTVIVKAEDEEHALEVASDNVSIRGVDTEMQVEKELKTEEEIERAIRFSDYHFYDCQKKPYDE